MTNFETMNGPALVKAFNDLAKEAAQIGMPKPPAPVSRFADAKSGAKRCVALASAVRAFGAGQKAADAQENEPVTTATPRAGSPGPKLLTEKLPRIGKPKAKNGKTPPGGLVGLFQQRTGTNRERLILALEAQLNKDVPLAALAKFVYGKADQEAALLMVMKGLVAAVSASRSGYTITKTVDAEGVRHFGLHKK